MNPKLKKAFQWLGKEISSGFLSYGIATYVFSGTLVGLIVIFWHRLSNAAIILWQHTTSQWTWKETIIILDIEIMSFIFFFLLGIYTYKKRVNKKNESNETRPFSIFDKLPSITDKSKFLDHPTPADIAVKMNSQSPYLLDETAKAFTGLLIHWRQCSLSQVIIHPNESVVSVYFDDDCLKGAVDVKEYPIIKSAARGTQFDIWAEITEINWPIIYLSISIMELHKLIPPNQIKEVVASRKVEPEEPIQHERFHTFDGVTFKYDSKSGNLFDGYFCSTHHVPMKIQGRRALGIKNAVIYCNCRICSEEFHLLDLTLNEIRTNFQVIVKSYVKGDLKELPTKSYS